MKLEQQFEVVKAFHRNREDIVLCKGYFGWMSLRSYEREHLPKYEPKPYIPPPVTAQELAASHERLVQSFASLAAHATAFLMPGPRVLR